MNKNTKITIGLLLGTFIILLIITFFLPDIIPYHFNIKGKAENYASKYFILLFTPVPYLIYRKHSK